MTWALFSTYEDMEVIESGLVETGLTQQEKNRLRPYINGGLGNWRNAPCIPPEHPCYATDGVESVPGGTCMRTIVCTHGTLEDFRDLLRKLQAKYPHAQVFSFFEPFMGNTGGGQWYAVDPYPVPPGYFNGMTC
jgi:hypothetical protein